MSTTKIFLPLFWIPAQKSAAQKAADKARAQERARNASAMKKAKKLAATCGVEIEKEGAGAYWVTHPDFLDSGDDPLEGSHFCSDGAEVLAAVEVYAAEVAKRSKA